MYFSIKESTMSSRMFSAEQKAKLSQLITEGIQVMQEVEDLNAGLSDTVKAVAEELEIKPAILKKAIKIAQKSKFTDTNADHEELTDILETVGRTL
jgi:transposase-like protein